MHYYKVTIDIHSPYGIVESPQLPDEASFLQGVLLTATLPDPLEFEVDYPAAVSPDHLMGDVIPVVSDQFAEALRQCGVNSFQTFPALVRNPGTGKKWTTFKAFNVLGLVDAVHDGASVGDTVMPGGDGGPPPLVDYEKLVFDARKVRGLLMLRLAQDPTEFFLADRVVEHLRRAAPIGGWGIVTREIAVL